MIVDMQEGDWIRVLNFLANYPFKQVAGLMQQIQMQLQQQTQPQQQQQMPRPNGQDADRGMRVSGGMGNN